jgi:hypothetical protein
MSPDNVIHRQIKYQKVARSVLRLTPALQAAQVKCTCHCPKEKLHLTDCSFRACDDERQTTGRSYESSVIIRVPDCGASSHSRHRVLANLTVRL